ncbi:MAG: hypothetical protein RLW62_09585 [Gammaproteobacteria bacterium]
MRALQFLPACVAPLADAVTDPRRRTIIVQASDAAERHRAARLCAALAGVAFGLAGSGAAATPSADGLAANCRAALAQGFDGLAAAACEWHLDPCTVCTVDAPPPTHCVPAAVAGAARAELLLGHLAAHPEDGARPAAAVVDELLATHFPCSSAAP